MFELPDDLIDESHFQVGLHMMAVTDFRGLTMMAETESIVNKVGVNIPSKELTKLDNLHFILRKKCLISTLKWI